MLSRNVYDAARVEGSPIEAGGRHDTDSSKKVRAPDLFLRSNYGQILQRRVRGDGKGSRHRLPLRTQRLQGQDTLAIAAPLLEIP